VSDSNPFTITIAPVGTTILEQVIYGGGSYPTAMTANSWRQLPATFADIGGQPFWYEPGGGGGSGSSPNWILDYSHDGYYDSIRKRVYHIGASYNNRCYWIVFDQVSNTWSRSTMSGWDIVHSFDHLAYNPTTGYFYFLFIQGFPTARLNVDVGPSSVQNWAGGPDFGGSSNKCLDYDSANNRLLFVFRDGTILALPEGSPTWTTLLPAVGGDAGYSQLAAYDAVHSIWFYGGGNFTPTAFKALRCVAAPVTSDRITITTSAPRIYLNESFMACEPVTGQVLLFNSLDASVYKFSHNGTWPVSGTWSQVSTMPAGAYNGGGNPRMFVTPLNNLPGGASAVMVVSSMDQQVWIYRYS
jgi:hypothetical protein